MKNSRARGRTLLTAGLINTAPKPDLYSDEMKRAVFAKAVPHIVPGFATDNNGKTIRFEDHGDRESPFGWEYDHWPVPVAFGGTDDLSNLRPLNCHDNAANRHGNALRGLINSRP